MRKADCDNDPNAIDDGRWTPLMHAIEDGDMARLIAAGADVNYMSLERGIRAHPDGGGMRTGGDVSSLGGTRSATGTRSVLLSVLRHVVRVQQGDAVPGGDGKRMRTDLPVSVYNGCECGRHAVWVERDHFGGSASSRENGFAGETEHVEAGPRELPGRRR